MNTNQNKPQSQGNLGNNHQIVIQKGEMFSGPVPLQGGCLSFTIRSPQTGVFTPPGETVILQSTANSVSSYEYTTGNKPFILDNAVLIESRTETTTTGNYYVEKLYLFSAIPTNPQLSLFGNSTNVLSNGNLNAIQILAHCLGISSVVKTSLTVQINFCGSEEEKVVLTGVIENALTNIPSENKINLDWEWFDV